MKISRILFTICIGISAQVSVARASLNTDCFDQTTHGLDWSYCITHSSGSKNPDILYYFHGLDGGVHDWMPNGSQVRAQWVSDKANPPTVVSISFGTAWILAPKSGSALTGQLMDFVMGGVLPLIEHKLGGLKGRRILLGQSMGGFNAMELFLWYPQSFERVAMICPAISDLSPFASDDQFTAFIETYHAEQEKVFRARDIARYLFQNQLNYDSISPFEAGSKVLNSTFPKVYLSIGHQDEYGFFSGTEKFAQLTQSRGISTAWYPVEGKHCSYDAVSLAKFLVQ